MIITHEIAGINVNPVKPDNISIEINHDQQSVINQPRPHVGISNLELRREDIKVIMDALKQSPGITEGIPYNIKFTERGVTEILQMYVDCMNGGFARSIDGLNVGIKMVQSLDNINDRMDSFTLESIYNEPPVTVIIDGISYPSYQKFIDDKTIFIPYVISTVPNLHDAFLAIFGITYVAVEFSKATKQIVQWFTPSIGIGVVVHVGQLVIEILFTVGLLITLVALITQLIDCLIQPLKYHGAMLMSDIAKVISAKLGLEFTSSIWSTYPHNQTAYLPEKFNPVEGNASSFNLLGTLMGSTKPKGYTSPGYAPTSTHDSQTAGIQHGYPNGVGGDFLDLIKKFCNGKYIIQDQSNKLILERRDYKPAGTPFKMQPIRMDWSSYNTDELTASIIISFLNDLNEKNCQNNTYSGTKLEATHQQITTNNAQMVCLKGLRQIQINAARGVAKKSYTFIEKVVRDLEPIWAAIGDAAIVLIDLAIIKLDEAIILIDALIAILNAIISALVGVINVVIDIVDAISSLFGGSGPDKLNVNNFLIPSIPTVPLVSFIPLSNNLSPRLNALLLEDDMVDIPKILLVDTSRTEFQGGRRIAYLHDDNSSVIHAQFLWDNSYCIDAFVGTPNNRFTKIDPSLNNPGEKNPCTLSLKDFKGLVSNAEFLDNFGEPVMQDSTIWFPHQNGKAEFLFRKAGWLADCQNPNGIKRSKEIAINLKLQISVPSGQ